MADAREHFEQLATWLDMESEAERQRMAARRKRFSKADVEASGESIIDLVVSDHETGVGGLFLLTFAKRRQGTSLPWTRLRVGSPVVVSSEEGDMHGVVSRRTQRTIQVAVSEWPDGDLFRLDLSPDERTRRQQQLALSIVEQSRGRLGELRKLFLDQREPKFGELRELTCKADLNASQIEAIRFAKSAEDIAIIHGPPGTGKTTTLVELIGQLIDDGQQVLACAPSNTAVDNLLERLVNQGRRAVRLGHPARVAESLRESSLDAKVQNHPDMKIVQELMDEADRMFRKASRYTRAKPARGQRQEYRQAGRDLKKDARRLEQQVVHHVLDRAEVICATTTLDDELLGDRHFSWLIIDEACQSTEPGCWVPLMRADRVVLGGDHCQLPPTVISTDAAKQGFAVSLMERTVKLYGDRCTRQLDVQYRMHEAIMDFSASQFYRDNLTAHESVAQHQLAELEHVNAIASEEPPVTFYDTAGANWDEELEPDGESRMNRSEAELVVSLVDEFLERGVRPEEVAVIAPYAAQVRWIRKQTNWQGVEIDTVDGFQGREKELVIISLVRSNPECEIGFLADTRRMNVALTRARRRLIVIGDSATLGGNDFYSALLEYVESIGAYRSVFERMNAE